LSSNFCFIFRKIQTITYLRALVKKFKKKILFGNDASNTLCIESLESNFFIHKTYTLFLFLNP